jgi:hypothetical protein
MVMTQLSRPYQIALLTMALLVGVWFLALRGHAATTPEPSSPSSAPAPTAAAEAKAAAAPTPVYKGVAPGVGGLTRAIDKAHEAVATSQQNAQQLEGSSAQASATGSPATVAPTSTAAAPAAVTPAPGTHAAVKPATTTHGAPAKVAPIVKRHPAVAVSPQVAVEAELKQGKIVAILFWNPKSTVDVAVGRELDAAARTLDRRLVVHETGPGQVGAFGSITRDVQVAQTPTILIITKAGRTAVLTGLTDAYSIAQAVEELQK